MTKKLKPVVEEWAEERGAVERQLARMAADAHVPSNPDVILADGAALVKLFRMTDDGKGYAAVKFQLVKGGARIAERPDPEVVSYRPATVLEYLEWLTEKPAKWMKDEICRATGVVPRGSLHRALKAYLASLYQRDLASTQDERWKTLNEKVEKHRFLADLPGLSESDFFIHAVSGELNEGVRKMLLTTHTKESDDMETVVETNKPEASKPVIVKKKVAAAPAAEAPKPAAPAKPVLKPKAEKKAVKPKAPKAAKPKAEAKTKAAPKLDKYGKAKVDAQRGLPVGKVVTYKGKAGKVVRHEARGGVFVEVGGKELLCSPFVLLKKPKNGDAKNGK